MPAPGPEPNQAAAKVLKAAEGAARAGVKAEKTTLGAQMPAIPAGADTATRATLLKDTTLELAGKGHKIDYIVDKVASRFAIPTQQAYGLVRRVMATLGPKTGRTRAVPEVRTTPVVPSASPPSTAAASLEHRLGAGGKITDAEWVRMGGSKAKRAWLEARGHVPGAVERIDVQGAEARGGQLAMAVQRVAKEMASSSADDIAARVASQFGISEAHAAAVVRMVMGG